MSAWAARYLVLLSLQAPIGCFLLAFNRQIVSQGIGFTATLAVVLIAANAVILSLWAGMNKLDSRQQTLFVAGVVLGGTIACLGAVLAAKEPLWNALTVGGTLFNMELASVVARLTPLARAEESEVAKASPGAPTSLWPSSGCQG